jgi:hypothetical protein
VTGAKILVVCDQAQRGELGGILGGAGLGQIYFGDGSDDTLGVFEMVGPEVVVVCAGLVHGDARSLCAALRSGDRGEHIQLVLIGDEAGPIRNALDAIDFQVDRFVGRPISHKALLFAVQGCLEIAQRSHASGAAAPPVGRRESTEPGNAPLTSDGDLLDDWEPAPQREPTLILPGGGAIEEQDWQFATGEDTPAPPGEFLDDETPAEQGALARELRRKMSVMARRLFPAGAAAPVDVDIAHGAHTDIDLSALTPVPVEGDDEDDGFLETTYDTFDSHLDQAGGDELTVQAVGTGTAEPARFVSAAVRDGDPAAAPVVSIQTVSHLPTLRSVSPRGRLGFATEADEIDIAALVARLANQSFTGRVVLRRETAEKVIHLDAGRPVFASSNLPHDRMGDLLFREGKITGEQHERSRALLQASGRRMGEILVEMGFLKQRELLPVVRRHVEDIIYSLFAWTTGQYELCPGDGAEQETIRLSVHPAAIVVEGVRRKYTLSALEQRIGPPGALVQVRGDQELLPVLAAAELGTSERAIARAFDGEHSLVEVADATGASLLAAYQLAYALVALGVAQVAGRRGEPAERPADRAPEPSEVAIDRQRVLARRALVEDADYFQLLGVRRDASAFEIRRAYEAARRDFDSGRYPRELHGELAEINGMIEEAFAVLRDDRLRLRYRANLRD